MNSSAPDHVADKKRCKQTTLPALNFEIDKVLT